MSNAHTIAIAAHEHAIAAHEDAIQRRSLVGSHEAAIQTQTAIEETAAATGGEPHEPADMAGSAAEWAATQRTEGQHAEARKAHREAIGHHRRAIAAHQANGGE